MSLNRCEDALLSYLRDQPDEKRFWTKRVLEIEGTDGPVETKAALLDRELRTYAGERVHADSEVGERFGAGEVSLRNLAEFLLAVWTPPRSDAKRRNRDRA